MYSDPSGGLQERLGMTLRSLDPGPEADKGDYQQMSMLKNGFLSAAVSRSCYLARPKLICFA